MKAMLCAHNLKFANPNASYEPPKHSVKDVKQWEKAAGKMWYQLSAADRAVVRCPPRSAMRATLCR